MPIVPVQSAAEIPSPPQKYRELPPARHRVRQIPTAVSQPTDQEPELKQSPDYEIGYGRPPAHTRFKPGKSGNPKGRPARARGLNTMAREMLTQRVPVRTASGEKKMSRIEAVLHKTFELALKGNPRALTEVLGLYGSAVPETAVTEPASPVEELSLTDLAILEEFKASLLEEAGR